MHRTPTLQLSAARRCAGAAGALLTSGGLLAALLGLFFQASSQPWLQPTPDVLQLAAGCQARPLRAERSVCLQQLLAQRAPPPAPSAPSAAPTRLARLGTDAAVGSLAAR